MVTTAFTCVQAASTSAHAQVAVAVTIAEGDASQRDIAARIVAVARRSWQMQMPQLSVEQTRGCAPGDTECLRKLADSVNASHLLVIGVAPLGVRDRVVAVQLFDAREAGLLYEESVVQSGLADDLPDVQALAARLVAVQGPPTAVEPVPYVAPPPEGNEVGVVGIGGIVLVSAGAGTALASLLTGIALIESDQPDLLLAQDVLLYGIAAGGVISAVGALTLLVDAL